jgi:double-stranded uracil-DNA glycosylase
MATMAAVDLGGARRLRLPDVIAPHLRVLFVGINPGLYSAAVGHHFARPGNRFWRTLHAAGFTPSLFSPSQDRSLLALGLGITNLAPRTTASADELSPRELVRGARVLASKAGRYRPRVVAILGIGAYRVGFARPRAIAGRQEDTIGASALWVLPNPSGRSASYQMDALVRHFRALMEWIEPKEGRASARGRG